MNVTEVWQWNWDAMHEPCPLKCGGHKDCEWCNGTNRKYKYIINRGSSRSSKTVSLTQIYDVSSRTQKDKRLTIWRDTKTDVVKTVLVDFDKMLKRENLWLKGYEFNKTNKIFTYNTGTTVEFHGTDDEETVHGLTQDYAWVNEPYGMSEETFNQIDQRTSEFIFVDYNPKKDGWYEKLLKHKRAIVLKSTFKNNPFCPPDQRSKILGYQPLSMSEVVLNELITTDDAYKYDLVKNPLKFTEKQIKELKRCLENESQQTANKFNWEVYGLGEKSERPNRILNWKPISLVDYHKINTKIWYGSDWGVVHPFAVVEVKYFDGALYVHELNYKSENEIAQSLNSTQRAQIGQIENEGLVTYLFKSLNIDPKATIVCDSNRPLKIAALRRAGWEYAEGIGGLKNGLVDSLSMFSQIPVYYTETSTNIAYEQENYERQTDRYGKVIEDPVDTNNHTIDAIRYVWLWLVRIYVIKMK